MARRGSPDVADAAYWSCGAALKKITDATLGERQRSLVVV